MKIPNKIKVGDKIGLISTARKITMTEIQPAIDILKSWGLKIILPDSLFYEDHQFSGTIPQRTTALQLMIDDPSINAILCARGGYGTVQIIDSVNFSNLRKNPKWLIGYSDVTVLHSHLNKYGISSLHATMPINFKNNSKDTLLSLKNILFEKKNFINCSTNSLNRLGRVQAEIVGGNLSIIYSLIGSESDLNTDGKILFIEDIDEYLYHLDRMMINLKRNNKFKHLKGMIVGGMTDMKDNNIPYGKSAYEIIFSHVKEHNFPICFGFPSGHLTDNRSIILGINSVLNIEENNVSLLQDF